MQKWVEHRILDQKHTVFGQVIEGLDIVDQIAAVEKGADDKPVSRYYN